MAKEMSAQETGAPTAPDRKERKVRAARALKVRRGKQLILGAGFLVLLAAGWLYPLLGYFIPVCMLLGVGMAAFRGRNWCDWLCPRGSFEDAWLSKISRQRLIPPVFRGAPLRLGVMALLMAVLTVQIIRLWPDPWAIGGFFILMLTLTTGAAVALGVLFHQRTWCYVCPIGTMSNWVGNNRRPLLMARERCTHCDLCTRRCPMQLAPSALKEQAVMPHQGDCLKCRVCVESCPTAALAFADRSAVQTAA